VPFETDRRALSQISSLAGNAIKFTLTGGVRLTLNVDESHAAEAPSCFAVQRQRAGDFRRRILATLFEPFVQGQAARTSAPKAPGSACT